MLPLIFIPLMFPFPIKNYYLSVPLSAQSFTEEQLLSVIQYSSNISVISLKKCLNFFHFEKYEMAQSYDLAPEKTQ